MIRGFFLLLLALVERKSAHKNGRKFERIFRYRSHRNHPSLILYPILSRIHFFWILFFIGLGPFSLKVVFSSPSFMASYSRILRLADWHHFVQLMLGKRASSSNRGKLCANQRNQLFCRWMLPAPHRGHRGVGLLRHGNSANVRKPRVQGSDTGGQIHTSVRRRTRRGLCARGRNQVSFAWNFLRGR